MVAKQYECTKYHKIVHVSIVKIKFPSLWRGKWQSTSAFLPGKSQGQKPGGLQSMGSQRVGHNWACTHILPPKQTKKPRRNISDEVVKSHVRRQIVFLGIRASDANADWCEIQSGKDPQMLIHHFKSWVSSIYRGGLDFFCCWYCTVPGSSPSWSRVFEGETA